MKPTNKRNERGEIILIILLVMAVGLTIGLAVASRSITDVRLSNQIEESSRAFSAAEAGIEEILKAGLISSGSTLTGSIGGTNYNVQLNSLGSTNIFTFPTEIQEGDAQTIWLVNQKPDGSGPDDSTRVYNGQSIDICWEDLGTVTVPAVEVAFLFKAMPSGEYKVARDGFDPISRSNGFSNASSSNNCNMSGSTVYSKNVNLNFGTPEVSFNNPTDIPIAFRIRPVYEATKIAAKGQGANNIPEQGKNIVSTGQTNSGVERRWNVVQTYASPNDIFDYAIWSNQNLTK